MSNALALLPLVLLDRDGIHTGRYDPILFAIGARLVVPRNSSSSSLSQFACDLVGAERYNAVGAKVAEKRRGNNPNVIQCFEHLRSPQRALIHSGAMVAATIELANGLSSPGLSNLVGSLEHADHPPEWGMAMITRAANRPPQWPTFLARHGWKDIP
jgi:hypothetical protein